MSAFPPEGFSPCYLFEGDPEKEFLLTDCATAEGLTFSSEQKLPSLPLLLQGKIWHEGWDIPTRWAIDSNKQCWMDEASGQSLKKVSRYRLLNSSDELSIRQVLGVRPKMPDWAKAALANGWTPPSTWDVSIYDA